MFYVSKNELADNKKCSSCLNCYTSYLFSRLSMTKRQHLSTCPEVSSSATLVRIASMLVIMHLLCRFHRHLVLYQFTFKIAHFYPYLVVVLDEFVIFRWFYKHELGGLLPWGLLSNSTWSRCLTPATLTVEPPDQR